MHTEKRFNFTNRFLPRPSTGAAKQQITIALLVIIAAAAAVIAVIFNDPLAKKGNRLGDEFTYDISELKKIDPALIAYEESDTIKTQLDHVHAVSAGPGDRIHVAGRDRICIYSPEGTLEKQFSTPESPTCLFVADDTTIYTAISDHIIVYTSDGSLKSTWEKPEGTPLITSITSEGDDVFASDAGNKVILHYTRSGELVNRIGKKDEDRHIPGILVPSPYFDIQMAPDGLLKAVNPGRFRIEAYTKEGDLEIWWGTRSDTAIESFCGCCNPAHMALLPDGSFVTSEKGIPRVKVYSPSGEFKHVVAGPGSFSDPRKPHDIAADSRGRILILDPSTKSVRIFTKKPRNK